jgi:hypothetical protein
MCLPQAVKCDIVSGNVLKGNCFVFLDLSRERKPKTEKKKTTGRKERKESNKQRKNEIFYGGRKRRKM